MRKFSWATFGLTMTIFLVTVILCLLTGNNFSLDPTGVAIGLALALVFCLITSTDGGCF